MPLTPHVEKHFTASETVRDEVVRQTLDERVSMTQPLQVIIIKPSKYMANGAVERFRRGFMPNSTVPYMRSMTPSDVAGMPVAVDTIDEYVHTDLEYLSLLRRPRGGRTLVV